jgi:hypothetical protein
MEYSVVIARTDSPDRTQKMFTLKGVKDMMNDLWRHPKVKGAIAYHLDREIDRFVKKSI